MQKAKNSQMKRQPRRDNRLAHLASLVVPSLRREVALGFPPRKRLTLRYADTYQFNSTTGSLTTQQIRVNSLYDPDGSGTGHQPRGFDQWCASAGPYNRYRVLAVRIALQVTQDSDTAGQPGQLVAGFSDLSTLPTVPSGSGSVNCAGQSELRGWKSCVVNPFAEPARMEFAARVCDIEGVTESSVLSEDNYSAAYNANPVDVAWFSMQALTLGSSTGVTYAQFEIEFDIQFEEPILLAQS